MPQETLLVLLLNARRAGDLRPPSLSGQHQPNCSPSFEVYRPAVLQNAPFILLAHNHPSGDPTPSAGDLTITEKPYRAGLTLNIGLMDHLVLGESGSWVSMRERGLGFPPETREPPAANP